MILSPDDKWSKRDGRWYAFLRAVESCGILRREASGFAQWFSQRFPAPREQRPVKNTLSVSEKVTLYAAGDAKRQSRLQARSAAATS